MVGKRTLSPEARKIAEEILEGNSLGLPTDVLKSALDNEPAADYAARKGVKITAVYQERIRWYMVISSLLPDGINLWNPRK